MIWLHVIHWFAGLIVLAEALNKLQRTDLFAGLGWKFPVLQSVPYVVRPCKWETPRVVTVLKVLGWALLAIGAGAAMVWPLIHITGPDLQDVCVLTGFALLIVRTRLRECDLARHKAFWLRLIGIKPKEGDK